ncbi:hypothetical protein G7Y89_g3736 [Cudoniella acicularis]|uniref:Uncharacterized protein n=1 Tax=Cudoniella acicularis TaxID=354080 RepID=A0A8H4RQS5_9HELO|nr:hypothetical protein G7Y89_g3736 [Cudoniella acicularis]
MANPIQFYGKAFRKLRTVTAKPLPREVSPSRPCLDNSDSEFDCGEAIYQETKIQDKPKLDESPRKTRLGDIDEQQADFWIATSTPSSPTRSSVAKPASFAEHSIPSGSFSPEEEIKDLKVIAKMMDLKIQLLKKKINAAEMEKQVRGLIGGLNQAGAQSGTEVITTALANAKDFAKSLEEKSEVGGQMYLEAYEMVIEKELRDLKEYRLMLRKS